MGYIYDADSQHLNIFKVLKIFNWPEYNNVTSACTFIKVCIYYPIWFKNFAQIAAPIYYLQKKNTLFVWDKEQVEAMDLLKLALTIPPTLVFLDFNKGAGDIIFMVKVSLEG